MKFSSKLQRGLFGLAGALVVSSALVTPAFASNSVSQVINGGSLTASIADASLTPVSYSNTAGTSSGTLTLTVNDAQGLSAGWTVSVKSGNFDYVGSSPSGIDIPSTGFSIVTAHDPEADAGQAVDALHGPFAMSTGALNTERTTIGVDAGYGSGIYSQDLDVSLDIPAMSQAGTYTATLVVATSVAP